ncbi:hypothetical protein CTI12_AA429870 [Artemisia annua]|uniref:Protein kinase domain-containing protein n=1 Tax=Artemisia annua TaxID=35608 RepID=A0A2U1M1Q1_ARTAN|nr:hypothetical protein CTI12_AA429870 [Artemisia annua]
MDSCLYELEEQEQVSPFFGGAEQDIKCANILVNVSGSVKLADFSSTREGRPNKKSKWDKVDGDRSPPLTTSSQDSVSSAGSHAALLTAANAGSGYTTFT